MTHGGYVISLPEPRGTGGQPSQLTSSHVPSTPLGFDHVHRSLSAVIRDKTGSRCVPPAVHGGEQRSLGPRARLQMTSSIHGLLEEA